MVFGGEECNVTQCYAMLRPMGWQVLDYKGMLHCADFDEIERVSAGVCGKGNISSV